MKSLSVILALSIAHVATASGPWIDPNLAPNPLFPPCANPQNGLQPEAVEKFLKDADASDTHALIVLKDGCTVIERHFGGNPDEVFSVQSVTKSITSLAIGALLDDKAILSLDAPISEDFPLLKNDQVKSKITLRHLLEETSGYGDWDTFTRRSQSLLDDVLTSPLQSDPGTQWNYSGMAVYLLGHIISNHAKVPADVYFQSRIFDRIDVHTASWYKGEDGGIDTGGGLYMSSRDMENIGAMMLSNGKWKGNQILSSSWIQSSVSSSQNLFADYGLLWWLYMPTGGNKKYEVYSAKGYQGQYITLYPKANLVVIRIHRVEKNPDRERLKKIFWQELPDSIEGLVAQ